MAVSRRQILTGGAAAGVGLSVAGVLPSLAAPAAADPAGATSAARRGIARFLTAG
ncbi:twin-arginine translocation signal domain-containing protein [Actinoplanes sp. KI2]|uniref:twin-arginine translocation signal domain-containing protein n=1 Tax=Actinoplanes sp. KI2 TaxID=2983315 RepID=UPI0021D5AB13|nr:twin-arginine translocation signal domain-containing protein [Actinoplanes sp. KI2]MCU7726033.1 twin-arginine translocation signal domain-containing protein [Actinoplanes sp. KI2]